MTDRRSGRGKRDEAPEHLPVPPSCARAISADELALVRHLVDEHRGASAAAEQAQRSLEAATRHLLKKYALVGQDRIELETGAIVRVPATASGTAAP